MAELFTVHLQQLNERVLFVLPALKVGSRHLLFLQLSLHIVVVNISLSFFFFVGVAPEQILALIKLLKYLAIHKFLYVFELLFGCILRLGISVLNVREGGLSRFTFALAAP